MFYCYLVRLYIYQVYQYIYIYIYILYIMLLGLLGRCERSLKLRYCLQLCLGPLTQSLPCLRACFFDRFPRGSREPASDGCSPMRASRSLAPPTSAATPNSRDICCGEGARSFYLQFEQSLRFRFSFELCLGLRTPSVPCLHACFFDSD